MYMHCMQYQCSGCIKQYAFLLHGHSVLWSTWFIHTFMYGYCFSKKNPFTASNSPPPSSSSQPLFHYQLLSGLKIFSRESIYVILLSLSLTFDFYYMKRRRDEGTILQGNNQKNLLQPHIYSKAERVRQYLQWHTFVKTRVVQLLYIYNHFIINLTWDCQRSDGGGASIYDKSDLTTFFSRRKKWGNSTPLFPSVFSVQMMIIASQ